MNEERGLPIASVGQSLKLARQQSGLTLDELSHLTRIPLASLEALEADDWGRLPGMTYVRGFVRAYAVEVSLDPEPLMGMLTADTAKRSRVRHSRRNGMVLSPRTTQRAGRGATGWAVGAVFALALVVWMTVEGFSPDEPDHGANFSSDSKKE